MKRNLLAVTNMCKWKAKLHDPDALYTHPPLQFLLWFFMLQASINLKLPQRASRLQIAREFPPLLSIKYHSKSNPIPVKSRKNSKADISVAV